MAFKEFVDEASSEIGEAGVVEGVDVDVGAVGCVGEAEVVAAEGSEMRGGASLSAGCRSGRGDGPGLEPLLWFPAACNSSLYPISPLFVGRGPASGRDSS